MRCTGRRKTSGDRRSLGNSPRSLRTKDSGAGADPSRRTLRATRAYIASAGTAMVMLAAALAMLTFVGAFVAFGSWPGQDSGSRVDQVLLNDVAAAKPKAVAVRADAVKLARRADAAVATGRRDAGARPGSARRTLARTPAGTPLASAPAGAAPATRPAPGITQGPALTVRQQTENIRQQVDTTTRDVGTQVQTQVQHVQTQVNEVVDQATGGLPPQTTAPVQQVQNTVGPTVTTVTDTAGSVLGH